MAKRRVANVVAFLLSSMALSACSSVSLTPYKTQAQTAAELSQAKGAYAAGTVSGQTLVESDELVKSSLPCRTRVIETPDGEPIAIFIANALKSELQVAGRLDANSTDRIDITVVKLESDTSKVHDGTWSIDLLYKIGRTSREIQTTTNFAFAADAAEACQNTADAFNPSLGENFKKFFATLH